MSLGCDSCEEAAASLSAAIFMPDGTGLLELECLATCSSFCCCVLSPG